MDRAVDFQHYAALPEGAGHVVLDGGSPAAIVWANRGRTRPVRVVDHVTIAPDADVARATVAALRAAVGAAEALIMTIPGPHPVVPWLLDRGARILDRDQFCATDSSLLDPERILPNPGFL